jgi:hypothetical protein
MRSNRKAERWVEETVDKQAALVTTTVAVAKR